MGLVGPRNAHRAQGQYLGKIGQVLAQEATVSPAARGAYRPYRTDLYGADLRNANLSGAELTDATMTAA